MCCLLSEKDAAVRHFSRQPVQGLFCGPEGNGRAVLIDQINQECARTPPFLVSRSVSFPFSHIFNSPTASTQFHSVHSVCQVESVWTRLIVTSCLRAADGFYHVDKGVLLFFGKWYIGFRMVIIVPLKWMGSFESWGKSFDLEMASLLFIYLVFFR